MRAIGRLAIIVLTCVLTAWSSTASAEFPVGTYTQFRNDSAFKSYLVGLGRGIFWANALLKVQGKPRLFCMPEHLNLDEGIILSLIDQEIRSPSSGKPWSDDAEVEFVMAVAFINRFPCTP